MLGSNGAKRMLWRRRLKMRPSTSFVASSASAVAYCQGTVLRNEIEIRASGKLESATDYVASAISDKHGHGEIAAKIQAHVIVAVV